MSIHFRDRFHGKCAVVTGEASDEASYITGVALPVGGVDLG